MLNNPGFPTSTHSGVKHHFSKHFILTGKIDKSLGKVFAKIYDLRHKGDYGDFFELDKEQTMLFFEPVGELLKTIESLLKNK